MRTTFLHKKGEIATTLTIVGLAVMMLGGLIGSAMNRRPQTTSSEAATGTISKPYTFLSASNITQSDVSKSKVIQYADPSNTEGIWNVEQARNFAESQGIDVSTVRVASAKSPINVAGGTIATGDRFFVVTTKEGYDIPLQPKCQNLACRFRVRVVKKIEGTDEVDERLVGATFDLHATGSDIAGNRFDNIVETANLELVNGELVAQFQKEYFVYSNVEMYVIEKSVPPPFTVSTQRYNVVKPTVDPQVCRDQQFVYDVDVVVTNRPVITPTCNPNTPGTSCPNSPTPTVVPPSNTPAPQACGEMVSTVELYKRNEKGAWVLATDLVGKSDKNFMPTTEAYHYVATSTQPGGQSADITQPVWHYPNKAFEKDARYTARFPVTNPIDNFDYRRNPGDSETNLLQNLHSPLNLRGGRFVVTLNLPPAVAKDWEFDHLTCNGTACVSPRSGATSTTSDRQEGKFECSTNIVYQYYLKPKQVQACEYDSTVSFYEKMSDGSTRLMTEFNGNNTQLNASWQHMQPGFGATIMSGTYTTLTKGVYSIPHVPNLHSVPASLGYKPERRADYDGVDVETTFVNKGTTYTLDHWECTDLNGKQSCYDNNKVKTNSNVNGTGPIARLAFRCGGKVDYKFIVKKAPVVQACPYTSTAYLDVPANFDTTQYRIQSSSGGGMISLLNSVTSPLGNGRKRVEVPYQTANMQVAPNTVAVVKLYKNGELVSNASGVSATCEDRGFAPAKGRCKDWYGNEVQLNLACNPPSKPGFNGQTYYGWVLNNAPTQGGGATPTPRPQNGVKTTQIDFLIAKDGQYNGICWGAWTSNSCADPNNYNNGNWLRSTVRGYTFECKGSCSNGADGDCKVTLKNVSNTDFTNANNNNPLAWQKVECNRCAKDGNIARCDASAGNPPKMFGPVELKKGCEVTITKNGPQDSTRRCDSNSQGTQSVLDLLKNLLGR